MPDFSGEDEVYFYLKLRFRELWGAEVRKRYGRGKLSPDIDLLAFRDSEAVGLEVKYFCDQPLRAYEGLGEAMAMLLYCVDRVYLVHVFDSSLEKLHERVVERAAKLVNLTPLGYIVMVGRSDPEVVLEAQDNPFKLKRDCIPLPR